MNEQRLHEGIRVLRTVQENQFEICVWRSKRPSYGFIACAVGHMAMDPWFNTHDLRMFYVKTEELPRQGTPTIGNVAVTYESLAAFFSISEAHARLLFSSFGYIAAFKDLDYVEPRYVAIRIVNLLCGAYD